MAQTLAEPHLLNSPRWKRRRVGILGGSFNPPHEGHVHISLAAMKGLELDAIWWLVTPQNPLKEMNPAPMEERIKLCQDIAKHPKIIVSDLERDMGTQITYDSIKALKQKYPHTHFAWISGMDNALSLHKWNHWRELLDEICMVHLTRNPARSLVRACPYRMLQSQKHIYLNKPGRMPLDSGTTYWMMQKKMVNISSTEIRNKKA